MQTAAAERGERAVGTQKQRKRKKTTARDFSPPPAVAEKRGRKGTCGEKALSRAGENKKATTLPLLDIPR